MKYGFTLRWHVVYSILLTLVAALALRAAFGPRQNKANFDEIAVRRINIVGPNGKTQMVISNREDMPEGIIDGKTFHSQGRHQGAGMIFYNAEGDEDGGLTFSGRKTAAGYRAGGGLLFDQYKQDQTVGVVYEDENGRREAGLHVWDRPNTDLAKLMEARLLPIEKMPNGPAKAAAIKKLREEGLLGASRVFVGKTPAENATVLLCDGKGRPRLRLSVTASGRAAVDFLNAQGKVVYRLMPPKK